METKKGEVERPCKMRVLLLASALVLSQAPRKASVCTDIDFDTADVTVSNFGDDKYCCNLCNKDDASLLCCPTLDKDGTIPPILTATH